MGWFVVWGFGNSGGLWVVQIRMFGLRHVDCEGGIGGAGML